MRDRSESGLSVEARGARVLNSNTSVDRNGLRVMSVAISPSDGFVLLSTEKSNAIRQVYTGSPPSSPTLGSRMMIRSDSRLSLSALKVAGEVDCAPVKSSPVKSQNPYSTSTSRVPPEPSCSTRNTRTFVGLDGNLLKKDACIWVDCPWAGPTISKR